MTRRALVMAGGAGARMKASGARAPKPLVEVAGASLLAHNLHQLVRSGFASLFVAVAAEAREVIAACEALRPQLARRGVALQVLIETCPLGNIGALSLLPADDAPVLTVFADNLTTLDAAALLDAHLEAACAATLATHQHRFQTPYGEVRIEQGQVLAYAEKPVHAATVCSAICAFAPRAVQLVASGEPLGLSQLVNHLLQKGERVCAFPHAEPWVDVNDLANMAAAEALVRAHPDRFAAIAPPAATVS